MQTAVEIDPAQFLQLPVATGVWFSKDDAGRQTTGGLAAWVVGHDPESDKIEKIRVKPGRKIRNPFYL